MVLLVALELGLRAAGCANLALRARQAEAGPGVQPGAIRLLHLGESTTFGLGVEREQAYPAVESEILAKRHPGHHFVSINRGVPGLVTAAMGRTLDEKLSLVHPALVTLMAGANDFTRSSTG